MPFLKAFHIKTDIANTALFPRIFFLQTAHFLCLPSSVLPMWWFPAALTSSGMRLLEAPARNNLPAFFGSEYGDEVARYALATVLL